MPAAALPRMPVLTMLTVVLFLPARSLADQIKLLYLTPPVAPPFSVTPADPAQVCNNPAIPALCSVSYYPVPLLEVGDGLTYAEKLASYNIQDLGPVRFIGQPCSTVNPTCPGGQTCHAGFCQSTAQVSDWSVSSWLANGSAIHPGIGERWTGNLSYNCRGWTSNASYDLGIAQPSIDPPSSKNMSTRSCMTDIRPVLCACVSEAPVISYVSVVADNTMPSSSNPSPPAMGNLLVQFNSYTNRAGTNGGASTAFNCSTLLDISPQPAAWTSAKCYFDLVDSRLLYADFGPLSNFDPVLNLYSISLGRTLPSPITSNADLDILGVYDPNPIGVTFTPGDPSPTVTPWLDAPKAHPTCNPNLTLSAWADFSAGRPYIAAVLTSSPFLPGGPPIVDPQSLVISIPSTHLSVGTYTFTLALTNWLNYTRISNTVTVQVVTFSAGTPSADITINGGSQPRTQSQLQQLIVGSNVYLDKACLGVLGTLASSLTLSYSWAVYAQPNSTWPLPLGPQINITALKSYSSSSLTLSSADLIALRVFGGAEWVLFRVVVSAGGLIGGAKVLGFAQVLVGFLDLPVNLGLTGPTSVVFNSTSVAVFNGTTSCDPNTQGVACKGPPPSYFGFDWVVDYTDPVTHLVSQVFPNPLTRRDLLGSSYIIQTVDTSVPGILKIASNQFLLPGIYLVTMTVFNTSTYQIYSGNAQWSFRVSSDLNCDAPVIVLPSFPSPVTINKNAPFFLIPEVNGDAQAVAATNYSWYVLDPKTQAFGPVPTSWAPFVSRVNLAIYPGILHQGASYDFRLVAQTTGCSLPFAGSISFNVNPGPSGGALQITPLKGTAFLDVFTLAASLFVDSDLPLQYYFELRRDGDINSIPLSALSQTQVLQTRLVPTDGSAQVTTTCVDSLGATGVALSNVTVLPLYTPNVTLCANLPDVNATISSVIQSGGSIDDVIRTLLVLADAATATYYVKVANASENQCLKAWRTGISEVIIVTVDLALHTDPLSLLQLSLHATALASALSGEAALLPGPFLALAAGLLKTLITEAAVAATVDQLALLQGLPGLFTASAAGPLLDALSGLVSGLLAAQSSAPAQGRRDLAAASLRGGNASTAAPTTPADPNLVDAQDALLDAIKAICSAVMLGYEPGCPPIEVQGGLIKCTITREQRTSMGDAGAVQSMTLSSQGPQASVAMPPGVLSNPENLVLSGSHQIPDTVDVALCHLKFNLHELVTTAQPPPPGVITIDLGKGRYVDGALATNYSVTEVFTLIFLGEGNSSVTIDPTGLSSTINVTIPLPDGFVAPTDNTTVTVCGAWNSSFGGWGIGGCTLADTNYQAGYVICACSHASDFTVWNSFVADITKTTIRGPIAIIAVVTLAILVPGLAAIWLVLLVLGRRADERDAENIQLGALLLLAKNKIRQRIIMRRFFRVLRNNVSHPQSLSKMDEEHQRRFQMSKVEEKRALKQKTMRCHERYFPFFISGFINALIYEHSVFGAITRFDPWYTRAQRFTVLAAVVVGNLFAASFFFTLKTANGISAGFFVGQVILAAVMVALPVRIVIRWLFRSTPPTTGDSLDQVVAIYRISEKNADLLPGYALSAEQADLEVVLALKKVQLCKGDVIKLEKCKGDLTKLPGMGEGNTLSKTNSFGHRLSNLTSGADYNEALANARANYEDAKNELREKCASAKLEWSRVPKRASYRVDTLRRQQSTVMKVAALIYDEADSRARPKPVNCSPSFIWVAWAFLIAYLIAGMGYAVFWVLKTDSAQQTQAYGNFTEYEIAKEAPLDPTWVITTWLIMAGVGVLCSLFVIEPVLQFLRFGIFAHCLHRFGRGTALHPASSSDTLAPDAALPLVPASAEEVVKPSFRAGKGALLGAGAAGDAPLPAQTAEDSASGGFEILAELVQNIA